MNRIVNKFAREASFQTGWYMSPPEFLSLIVTMQCNFRCQSCSIWQKPLQKELSEADWGKMVSKLSAELSPDTFVEINGGEPLTKKNLVLFLVKELKKHFKKVALNSNGLLINESVLDELKQSGLDLIKISLYSLDEKIHNSLRGHELAYKHAKSALENIVAKNIALEVGVLVTSKNIESIPDLINYLNNLENTSIILQPLDEKIESVESKNQFTNNVISDLWPDKKSTDEFFDWVVNNNKNIKNSLPNIKAIKQYYLNPLKILEYRCFAGQRNLVIYPDGKISFCFKMKEIGNLNKQDLGSVLKNSTSMRRQIKYCKKYCRIVGCNFSRGLREVVADKLL